MLTFGNRAKFNEIDFTKYKILSRESRVLLRNNLYEMAEPLNDDRSRFFVTATFVTATFYSAIASAQFEAKR